MTGLGRRLSLVREAQNQSGGGSSESGFRKVNLPDGLTTQQQNGLFFYERTYDISENKAHEKFLMTNELKDRSQMIYVQRGLSKHREPTNLLKMLERRPAAARRPSISGTDFVSGAWGDLNPAERTNERGITRSKHRFDVGAGGLLS